MHRARQDHAGLVELIYASLLDPDAQRVFAAALCKRMQSHLVVLQLDSPSHIGNPVTVFDACGAGVAELVDTMMNCEHPNAYMDNGGQQKLVAAQIGHDADLLPDGFIERTDFYHEVMRPFDIHHSMAVCLSAHAGYVSSLTFNRSKRVGYFNNDDVAFLRTLYPHLHNVHALQCHFGQSHAMATALDLAAPALWLVDAQGRCAFRNLQAQCLLQDGSGGVSERARRPQAAWQPDRRAFDSALRAATGPGLRARQSLQLHDSSGRPCAIAQFHPLPPSAFAAWLPGNPAVATLRLHPFAPAPVAPGDILRKTFALTPAEADLACALLQHDTLNACAQALGKSRETLRTQLKALFAKTGTRSQAALISRLQAATA